MSIQFIGDCDWKAIDAPKWTLDGWGVDHAIVPYCGRKDKKDSFLSAIERFAALAGYEKVRLATANQSGGTINIPIVDLNFVGFRNGTIPPAKPANGTSAQSIALNGVTIASQVPGITSGTISYKASRTTWTWFETSVPDALPRFNTVDQKTDPFLTITSFPTNSLTFDKSLALTQLRLLFLAKEVVAEYVREPLIPNALYACSSTVDYKLTTP
jgi:hypothetical protein